MANRGIPRGQFKHGLRTSRLILDGSGGAVETPFHLTPQSPPTGTAVKGDLYYDTTSLTVKAYTGAAWVDAGGIQIASFQLKPFATVTEYDLMIAPRALRVTAISVVPSTLQGGALTATIVKATGTATPANGTTPMHTANSINLNTGAYTVQNITLTSTTADLILAAGERIAIDFSAAYTAGHAALTISYIYV